LLPKRVFAQLKIASVVAWRAGTFVIHRFFSTSASDRLSTASAGRQIAEAKKKLVSLERKM